MWPRQSEATEYARRERRIPEAVDVCLIVEGCYPYRRGGVSNWVDTLLRDQSTFSFAVVSIQPANAGPAALYSIPSNVRLLQRLELGRAARRHAWSDRRSNSWSAELADRLVEFSAAGGLQSFRRVLETVRAASLDARDLSHLVDTRAGWDVACRMYRTSAHGISFRNYYWAWRALLGGLFATLAHPLPRARVFHAASTGFSGLLAARAAVETGRPALLTEHGIYTNERLIEILLADWISDDIEVGFSVRERRPSLRSFWIDCFESYARTCYEASETIVTLFSENQTFERDLGADPAKLRVIPNGVHARSYSGLPIAPTDATPTVALIGRVVPIKDVKTFLLAVRAAREQVVNLKGFVLGDLAEDPAYARQCRAFASELGLDGCVEFTGTVDVAEMLPRLHVVVLTSLSESQPLVILEAGAAGVPCIASDVGACREMILGRSRGDGDDDPGGMITPPLAPRDVADAMIRMLRDHDFRRRCGKSLRKRVRQYYDRDKVREAYRELYQASCHDSPASMN